ncbi:hypothetical protein [uncultured Sphingomonas sp.]|uniref:hypothetical protein n=1 Tax=uncultured Sphingomonas sp. TaxID=158754 RepID=UPI0025CEAA6E|nr:hypothetical protein [uncultured Sphingomonas sp.]
MAVIFVKPCQQGTLYNVDEVAGFDKDTEKRLIDQEFAKAYKPAKTEAPAA